TGTALPADMPGVNSNFFAASSASASNGSPAGCATVTDETFPVSSTSMVSTTSTRPRPVSSPGGSASTNCFSLGGVSSVCAGAGRAASKRSAKTKRRNDLLQANVPLLHQRIPRPRAPFPVSRLVRLQRAQLLPAERAAPPDLHRRVAALGVVAERRLPIG